MFNNNRLILLIKSIFILILPISVSCHHYKQKNSKEIIEQFKEIYHKDTCLLLEWNSTLLFDTDEYFLWKKYGILTGFLKSNNYYDACRAEAMKEILTEKYHPL